MCELSCKRIEGLIMQMQGNRSCVKNLILFYYMIDASSMCLWMSSDWIVLGELPIMWRQGALQWETSLSDRMDDCPLGSCLLRNLVMISCIFRNFFNSLLQSPMCPYAKEMKWRNFGLWGNEILQLATTPCVTPYANQDVASLVWNDQQIPHNARKLLRQCVEIS